MRLLVAISHHGLGHLAQAAPIVNTLAQARPGIEWLIWSGLPGAALADHIHAPFTQRHDAADVGLVMHDALRVDVAASLAAHRAFHQDWPARVAREAAWLRAQRLDAVLADVACLPLAAAARADIPAVGFCSLNWVDIVEFYLGAEPGMAAILADMRAAYASARAFLRLTPGMPMDWLENRQAIPPVAARAPDRRAQLRARLGLHEGERLVLIGFGGIGYRGRGSLPELPGVVWLVPDDWVRAPRADLAPFSRADLPFADLLASCDALITKNGYGSFVEAASHGVPVLHLERPDWPEAPWLTDWLHRHTRALAIGEDLLASTELGRYLERLWHMAPPPVPLADGARIAAARILDCLG